MWLLKGTIYGIIAFVAFGLIFSSRSSVSAHKAVAVQIDLVLLSRASKHLVPSLGLRIRSVFDL